jgi:hypothetical protein
MDAHANFAYSTVATAPVPALTGLSLTVAAGQGALFPAAPFNSTVWPAGTNPLAANAEIIRVTAVVGDVLTIVRAQEGTAARSIVVGDQIANTVSVKVFTDIETVIIQSISAGVGVATAPQVVFSNSNGVSFGVAGQTITGSVATNYQSPGAYLTTAMLSNAATISNVNISGGTTSSNVSAVTFANSNGVTFGYDGTNITATVQTNYLTTAMASNRGSDFVQATAAFAGTNASGTINSTGISVSVAGPAAASVNFSAGTTSSGIDSVVFSNSNGVTFGLNGSTITATVQTDYLTTAMASNRGSDFVQATAAFAGTNASGTINSTGISVSVAAAAGQTVQPVAASASNGSFLFSTVAFSNANNVTFGTSAGSIITASVAPPTAATVNFSAGTTSSGLDSVVFSNSNNVSFGLNGSTITATVTVATSLTNINVSAGTTSNNLSAVVFSNSNQLSFGLNGSTITASFNPVNIGMSTNGNTAGTTGTFDGGGLQYIFAGVNEITLSQSSNASSVTLSIVGPEYVSSFANGMAFPLQNLAIPGSATSYAVSFFLPRPISASFLRFPVVMTTNSTRYGITASSMSASVELYTTWNAVIYKLNTGASSLSLTWVTSATAAWTVRQSISVATNGTQESYTQGISGFAEGVATNRTTQYSISNVNSYSFTTAQIFTEWSGNRFCDLNLAASLSAGPYVMLVGMSTSSATNSTGISLASQCNVGFASFNVMTQANLAFGVMGSTNFSSLGFGAGSFTTVGGGTTAALPISAISSVVSNQLLYFQILRSA